jgi:hypothetical protein
MKKILDDKRRAAIIGVLSVGGTYALAAQRVGCCRRTIFRTANRDPKFRRQLNRAKSRTEYQFLKTIERAGKDNWQAARWALQHVHPDRYNRRAFTMSLAEVKDLISQFLEAIAQEITDSKTRMAIRRRIKRLTDSAIAKAKERARGR